MTQEATTATVCEGTKDGTADAAPFLATPKWKGDSLYVGEVLLGRISRPIGGNDKRGLIAVASTFIGGAAEFAKSEADARTYVERAVQKALGGIAASPETQP